MNELVSIIVPCLNEQEVIGQLINSVKEQDYTPLELIIVDGGSKDNTTKIIEEKMNTLNNKEIELRLLHSQDYNNLSSLPNNRNIGLEEAKGSYLLLLDADMLFLKSDAVSKILKELKRREYIAIRNKVFVDTKLEYHLSLNDTTLILAGFKTSFIGKTRFNPHLGYGENVDFYDRIGADSFNPPLTKEVLLGIHQPHTLRKYCFQQVWYGRTYFDYIGLMLKTNNRRAFLKQGRLIFDRLFFVILPWFVIFGFSRFPSTVVFSLILLSGTLLKRFLQSSEKSFAHLLFLLFDRFYRSYCFIYGLILRFIFRVREPARDLENLAEKK
jgi:glycosyltransferase involved in cell wall biosynthesis